MSDLLQKWRHEAKTRLPELLDEVATSIKRVHPDCTVILFGSYARGEQREDSDLDICVLVPELTYRRADMEVDAACAIRENFPIPMDLMLYTHDEFEEKAQKKYFVQYDIKKDGVVLGA
ncbi:MAG: nucleotidyltransferase domain-containing protein [Defluviitaleaceae bacterium]|nr:nucleotidyltransferase domain-containing protein [Defluviitaleaceae bacterium]MCL2274169.1 nucleotidyltransferase domain-containing protein [Defluviitaleaceae bacterium]